MKKQCCIELIDGMPEWMLPMNMSFVGDRFESDDYK